MDPSPFNDRDLDAHAEEFIVGWARELPPNRELKLMINLVAPPPEGRAAETLDAVQNYFSGRTESKRREFRQLMRRGRISLVIGLLFLTVALLLETSSRNLAAQLSLESSKRASS
jgi:hypothetical protein